MTPRSITAALFSVALALVVLAYAWDRAGSTAAVTGCGALAAKPQRQVCLERGLFHPFVVCHTEEATGTPAPSCTCN